MQEWLNNKKNLPIIIALSAVIMVAAIVFILFQTGVLGGTPDATVATAPPEAPVAPAPTPAPVPAGAPAAPTVPGAPAAVAAAPTQVAAAPVIGAPGARPDPFAGYVDFNTAIKNILKNLPPPPRVDSYVPFVRITNYVPPNTQFQRPIGQPGPLPPIPGGPQTAQNIGRVSGVMLTNGAFAIVDDQQGQSSILQPGDQLPNGAGRVVSIQSDGITVRTTADQLVKVPISAGDSTNAPGGEPNGPQGPPNIPGPPQDQQTDTNGG